MAKHARTQQQAKPIVNKGETSEKELEDGRISRVKK